MVVFRQLVYAALCAGLLAGTVATIAHQFATVPLILKSETYEAVAQQGKADTHQHQDAGWAPENRIERVAFTPPPICWLGSALLCCSPSGWRCVAAW